MTGDDDQPCLSTRLLQLQDEHRELDRRIEELQAFPYKDQLQLQRLKKRKLYLKDCIEHLRNQLIPDLNA